jgi:hypothetical protein
MPDQAASDASFYAIVHHVLAGKRQPEPVVERRGDERCEFTNLQFVAPYHDGQLPSEEDFQQVMCKDLSPRGLSYLIAQPPKTDMVVVALGAKSPIFLSPQQNLWVNSG